MPHPVYGAPEHRLERIDATLYLPTSATNAVTKLTILGRSDTCRRALWKLSQDWAPNETRSGYEPNDMMAHAILVAIQDRPTSQGAVDRSMAGEGWQQGDFDWS